MKAFHDDQIEDLAIKSVEIDLDGPDLQTQEEVIQPQNFTYHDDSFVEKVLNNINWIRLYFLPLLLLLFVFFTFSDVDQLASTTSGQTLSLIQKPAKLSTIYDNVVEQKVVTSCERKFPPQSKYNETVQSILSSLKQKTYMNNSKYSTKSPNRKSNDSAKTAPIKQFAQQANAKLRNPEYPEHLHQIMGYLPYQQLPFCLIVKQSVKAEKPFQQIIAKSIFQLNYTNYIAIFISSEDQGLSYEILAKILNQTQFGKQKINRMFYRINYISPNYYEYKLIIHQLCVPKSVLMFVSNALNSDALTIMNNYHQLYPVYMTYSQNKQFFLPNSFLMRLFDLIGSNDFGGANSKYFTKIGQQKLFSLGLMELCRNFTKKFPLQMIYNEKSLGKKADWANAIGKQDNETYTRYVYQPLITLSQTSQINVEEKTKILLSIKGSTSQYQPNPKTQLTPQLMFQALESQQSVFFPEEYSMVKKQYAQNQNSYGALFKFDKPYLKPLPQRSFCVVIFGNNQTGLSSERSHRYVRSVRAVLRQNYSNFHVVYLDDGVLNQTKVKIEESVKQSGFPSEKLVYIKNKKTMFPLFNIIRASFEYCEPQEMQIVIDNDFLIIDSNYFSLLNKINGYNSDLWVINTNFKTDKHKFGYAYRIENDNQYRDFTGRVKNLRYLSPLPVWQVRLIRSIPLQYHLDKSNEWMKNNWHKALQHSITQLATVSHIQYIPEICFEVSDEFNDEYANQQKYEQSINYINSKQILRPLNSLNSRYLLFEPQMKENIGKYAADSQGTAKSHQL